MPQSHCGISLRLWWRCRALCSNSWNGSKRGKMLDFSSLQFGHHTQHVHNNSIAFLWHSNHMSYFVQVIELHMGWQGWQGWSGIYTAPVMYEPRMSHSSPAQTLSVAILPHLKRQLKHSNCFEIVVSRPSQLLLFTSRISLSFICEHFISILSILWTLVDFYNMEIWRITTLTVNI